MSVSGSKISKKRTLRPKRSLGHSEPKSVEHPLEGSSRVVLDTSAYAHLRVNHEGVIHRIARADVVFLPTIVMGELEAGFLLGTRTVENRMVLKEFLQEPFVSILPVTQDVALRYSEIFVSLRKAGTPIPINDVWIAAITVDAGAHLLTFDRDFEHIHGLSRTIFKI